MNQRSIALLGSQRRICKICDAASEVLGCVPFSKGKPPTLCGEIASLSVFYNICPNCGTLFTCAFDQWTTAEFAYHIYNEDYSKIDSAIETGARASQNAEMLSMFFRDFRSEISVLDFGGATGSFVGELQNMGFADVHSHDPFLGLAQNLQGKTFDVVTSFEVLEHLTTPVVTVKELCGLVKLGGMIIFSTQVLPSEVGLDWWYVSPRSGHVTIYTKKSLSLCFESCGFRLVSFSDGMHIAYQTIPSFAQHFLHCDIPPDFDPEGYLRMNPDVKAAGMDPGGHYVQNGWRENRQWA